jgi:hypothetical protein
MKIRPVGAELLHEEGQTDGQTDMTKLIVAFRSSTNAPKNVCYVMKSPMHSGRIKIYECRLDK